MFELTIPAYAAILSVAIASLITSIYSYRAYQAKINKLNKEIDRGIREIKYFEERIAGFKNDLKNKNEVIKAKDKELYGLKESILSHDPLLESAREIVQDFKTRGFSFIRIDSDNVLLRK